MPHLFKNNPQEIKNVTNLMHVYLELELYIIKVAFSVSCTKHGNVTFLAFTRIAIQRVIPALLVSMSFSE